MCDGSTSWYERSGKRGFPSFDAMQNRKETMESNIFCGIERDGNIKILASDKDRPGALRAGINAEHCSATPPF